MNNNSYTFIDIIRLIINWKKQLLIVAVISIAFAIVFSSEFFIKPIYKSYAIVYPANLTPYGSETPTEQMLQLFESDDIRNKVVTKFDLLKHYNIDTTEAYYKYKIINKFNENVIFKKTEYESVRIEVKDINPTVAYEMVKEILNSIDIKARTLQREKTRELLILYGNEMDKKKKEMDSLDLLLTQLRLKYGLLNYDIQTKEVEKNYLKDLSAGKTKGEGYNTSSTLIKNLQEKGGEFNATVDYLSIARGVFNDLKLLYEAALKDMNKELTYSNLIVKPYPPDKKSSPVRWLIVLISFISSEIFALVILILIQRFSNIDSGSNPSKN